MLSEEMLVVETWPTVTAGREAADRGASHDEMRQAAREEIWDWLELEGEPLDRTDDLLRH